MSAETIFALSSGNVPSGVAIIRISGSGVRFAFETMIGSVPQNRKAALRNISDSSGILIDRGLSLFFQSPGSFTGEDCGEFHIHGGRAVVDAVLRELRSFEGFRLAEPGEFSRRAFENGKLDLSEIEGLSDLIAANTKEQHIQALNLSSGRSKELYSDWRTRLIRLRALLEAELDFSEEDDVSANLDHSFIVDLSVMAGEISDHLDTSRSGEIIRDGFRVALMGAPNSGKSSLLNALAKRDVAIVSEIAGTTRDVISVNLNIGGYEVVFFDTAGIRDTVEVIESIGISRALEIGKSADLAIWLDPLDEEFKTSIPLEHKFDDALLRINSKSDLVDDDFPANDNICISTKTGLGLSVFEDVVLQRLKSSINVNSGLFVARLRHKFLLTKSLAFLEMVLNTDDIPVEIVTEHLRLASDQLGKIAGKIDVENMLDVIFGEFCVGK